MTSTEPGRGAIDAALGRHFHGVAPEHVVLAPETSGGLRGCSLLRTGEGWFFVTYGLSQLGAKSEDDDPDWSGWGFELTVWVPGDGAPAPAWPVTLLSRVAEHVNGQGVLLEDGDRVAIAGSGPVSVGRDPVLGEIATPNGKVIFLRVEQ